MTGSTAQLVNGIMLLFTFFGCRLVYGTYSSMRVFQDVYNAWNQPVPAPLADPETGYARDVPLWLAFSYLGANVTLNSLNWFWFSRMIDALKKRFETPKGEEAAAKSTAAARRKSLAEELKESGAADMLMDGDGQVDKEKLADLVAEKAVEVEVKEGEGEDDSDLLVVEGTEIEVPQEIVDFVEKQAEGLRSRAQSLSNPKK